MERLPIDDVLPQVQDAVRATRTCVLVAPPGAGKTTRVPGALLELVAGSVVVLQPRRLAARLAAARIASERGVPLGGEVGYHVRFDRKASAATRIELVTEGVLTRRLLGDGALDGALRGVGCVVIDEFHERHIDGDLALALVARLRERRPELALVVMSATLDAEPVAAFLGGAPGVRTAPPFGGADRREHVAPIVRSEGRAFPLAIEHAERADDRPLGKQVSAAVRRACQDGLDGDVLVFLPGTAEIRRCAEDLADVAGTFDLAVLPLHGELTADEQDAAVRPAPRRKVILATNVAETSVTIDGVTCVIDSGLARVARHSPWSGIPSLEIEPVSRASCAQRAGRAGRTRPGRVIRLYTKHDHDTRRAFDVPEIARTDLAGPALELHGAGIAGTGALRWFEPPPPSAAAAAETLLERLGALRAEAGATDLERAATPEALPRSTITPLGRRMLRFPAHPRVARLLCEAEARGVAREACVIAGLLGTRELRLDRRGPGAKAQVASPSDLIDDLDAVLGKRGGLDRGTLYAVERAAKQLERIADLRARGPAAAADVDVALQLAILTAYPDRVGKRRTPRSSDFVFAGGGSGALAPSSAVIEPELIVAVDVADTGRGAQIRRASGIEASWLLDLYLDRIAERDELMWDAARERVERVVQMTYDGLVIDEHRDVVRISAPPFGGAARPGEAVACDSARRVGRAAAELLAKQALAAGIARFADADALAEWRARVALAATLAPASGLVAPTDDALAGVLAGACEGATSFAELRELNLLALLDAQLGENRALVDRLAPTHFTLPNKRRAKIHYALDQAPYLASRIQDFFGLAQAPAIGGGRVPLVLHLLAPNQRPVQVTTDLPNFWVAHYPALRRQLMRRYPRHAWPEDPRSLVAE